MCDEVVEGKVAIMDYIIGWCGFSNSHVNGFIDTLVTEADSCKNGLSEILIESRTIGAQSDDSTTETPKKSRNREPK